MLGSSMDLLKVRRPHNRVASSLHSTVAATQRDI